MRNKTQSFTQFISIMTFILSFSTPVQSQKAISTTIDCSDVVINYEDNLDLTTAEKLALMDRAFYDSLNKFEFCNLSSPSATTSVSTKSGGEAGGSSMSSEMLQGTEPEMEISDTTVATSGTASSGSTITVSGGGGNNGKIPEDIPPAANDDAIAAQIRIVAESEADPEIRKKLWNEYRKYKGINSEQ
jgi:hypothetical protein